MDTLKCYTTPFTSSVHVNSIHATMSTNRSSTITANSHLWIKALATANHQHLFISVHLVVLLQRDGEILDTAERDREEQDKIVMCSVPHPVIQSMNQTTATKQKQTEDIKRNSPRNRGDGEVLQLVQHH